MLERPHLQLMDGRTGAGQTRDRQRQTRRRQVLRTPFGRTGFQVALERWAASESEWISPRCFSRQDQQLAALKRRHRKEAKFSPSAKHWALNRSLQLAIQKSTIIFQNRALYPSWRLGVFRSRHRTQREVPVGPTARGKVEITFTKPKRPRTHSDLAFQTQIF